MSSIKIYIVSFLAIVVLSFWQLDFPFAELKIIMGNGICGVIGSFWEERKTDV
jgi:hypothetical protein